METMTEYPDPNLPYNCNCHQFNSTRLRQFFKGHNVSEECRDELPKSYDMQNLNHAY